MTVPVRENSGSSGAATSTSIPVALASGTTAVGNTLIVVVVANGTAPAPPGGQGFVKDVGSALLTVADTLAVWRKPTVAGESAWTFTLSVARVSAWWVAEIAGFAASPLDRTAAADSATGTGTTQTTGTTATTTQATEYAVAAVAGLTTANGGTRPTFSAWTNSFTERADVGTTAASVANVGLGAAARDLTSTGVYETTATLSQTTYRAGLIATYKLLLPDSRPPRSRLVLPPERAAARAVLL